MIETLDGALLAELALPAHDGGGDKEDRGRALIVGGSSEIPGGALLAGVAALRAGCGKLQIATDAAVAPGMALAVPEARVVVARIRNIDALLSHCDAAAFGPGWLDEPAAARVVRKLCSTPGPPILLDAAALVGARFVPGERALALTPHAGEMASLMDMEKAAVEADPVAVARACAERFGAFVALKGAVTHIASPDGRILRHESGVFGLATSGSGDVLTGLVTGLMARGAEPLTALAWGVFVHARAGRRLSEKVGPLGFLAREILDEIPRLLALGAGDNF